VVENQPPVPLLLYPYSRKAVVTRDSFASVLPIHCGAASFDSRVSVNAHLNLVCGDGLKFQLEVCFSRKEGLKFMRPQKKKFLFFTAAL
jgi:hypothetical protein